MFEIEYLAHQSVVRAVIALNELRIAILINLKFKYMPLMAFTTAINKVIVLIWQTFGHKFLECSPCVCTNTS